MRNYHMRNDSVVQLSGVCGVHPRNLLHELQCMGGGSNPRHQVDVGGVLQGSVPEPGKVVQPGAECREHVAVVVVVLPLPRDSVRARKVTSAHCTFVLPARALSPDKPVHPCRQPRLSPLAECLDARAASIVPADDVLKRKQDRGGVGVAWILWDPPELDVPHRLVADERLSEAGLSSAEWCGTHYLGIQPDGWTRSSQCLMIYNARSSSNFDVTIRWKPSSQRNPRAKPALHGVPDSSLALGRFTARFV